MNKTIQSGRLTQSVEIHSQSTTKNDLLERENTWTKISNGDWRVEIETASGGETETPAGQLGTTRYKVKGYYRSDIDASDRLVWGSIILDILHIENVDHMNQVLILDCEQVTRGGVTAR